MPADVRSGRSHPIPEEILMRILALTIPAIATMLAVAPASAQTYAPGYPICMQVWGPINYYDCRFTSMPQCNATASGRPAQCVVNPFFASAESPGPVYRHRRPYY
jgi:Protein of unknown function (DUF3551)